ncbi:MAG: NADH-quinone oxidoreductase subunit NuoE [Deltaproteobacteria bacterium]|nr:NADH-quinone oxidoreductase subunit NuoE [Deltaproteobacteria bacterium]
MWEEDIEEIIQRYRGVSGGLMPALHELQGLCGNYLPEEAVKRLAEGLNVSFSQAYGVATFYTMFSVAPRGKNIIRVCESPPCHLMGAESIIEIVEDELGVRVGETTPDGRFTLELTSCIGVCGVAPAIMINEEVYGNLTRDKIPEILKKYR